MKKIEKLVFTITMLISFIFLYYITAYYLDKYEQIKLYDQIELKAMQSGGTDTDYQNAIYQICNEKGITDQEYIEELLNHYYL